MRIYAAIAILLGLGACGGGSPAAPSAPPPPPPPGSTAISAVQGAGDVSPLDGQTLTIAGLVSGDFQDNDANDASNLGGFYVQSETPDADPATSEGVFVFDGSNPNTDVGPGDRVTVTGTVQEFFGETQITANSVSVSGSAMLQPIDLLLPFGELTTNSDGDRIANLEAFEGMLVRFPQALSITEIRNLERYGDLALSQGGRLYQFTNGFSPDTQGYAARRDMNALRTIVLDDGLRGNNDTPIRYLNAGVAPNQALRIGDTVTGISGNLRYARGSGGNGVQTWRLMPANEPAFASLNPRPGAPTTGGALRIASFNVLNYFSTIDSGQSNCGPTGSDNCRGADSSEELNRQIAKIVTALAMIDADIVGLIELENNASDSLAEIVAGLNASMGAGLYAFVNTGTIGSDAIKTGFIYKTATISPVGQAAILDGGVDPRFNDNKNRPTLLQSFAQQSNGAVLTIALNHLKSKGSDCDDVNDPNTSDGQGNCNLVRSGAAAAIADWLALDPTASGDTDFLIIGDLNAYLQEDALTTLENAGFTNLAAGSDAYSFVFDGQSGALDHALASSSLVPQVVEVMDWHINADEAPVRDYNLEFGRDPGIFDASTPYRASDHDPLIIGLDLN